MSTGFSMCSYPYRTVYFTAKITYFVHSKSQKGDKDKNGDKLRN